MYARRFGVSTTLAGARCSTNGVRRPAAADVLPGLFGDSTTLAGARCSTTGVRRPGVADVLPRVPGSRRCSTSGGPSSPAADQLVRGGSGGEVVDRGEGAG